MSKNKQPFTEEEQEIMDHLVAANDSFVLLTREDSQQEINDMIVWINSMNRIQDLLGARVLRRDYPNYFKS